MMITLFLVTCESNSHDIRKAMTCKFCSQVVNKAFTPLHHLGWSNLTLLSPGKMIILMIFLFRLLSALKQSPKSVNANLWLGQACYLLSNKEKETTKYLLTVRLTKFTSNDTFNLCF